LPEKSNFLKFALKYRIFYPDPRPPDFKSDWRRWT